MKIMKPQTINQEVLLFTTTSFSKKQFCEKDHMAGPADPSEELQKACWSGMLFEILPDLLENSPVKTFVWEVIPAETFIRIRSGSVPKGIESETSIDPYFFLPVTSFN
jgi:hypothetical protein